ncbi:MAG: hypothetical protein HY801_13230 [Candidatus Lindowbacteria bacterium]|nr:hypothetical protein [Candidatus Lindowbacteria bacterium]
MAKKETEHGNDRQIDRMFERQKRQLNQKRLINAVGGAVLLAAILIALRFTPYRNVPREIIKTAADFVKGLTSGASAQKETDPKYW